jgi:hypothetical protein
MLIRRMHRSTGRLLLRSVDAPEEIVTMPVLWGAATGNFQPTRCSSRRLPSQWNYAEMHFEGSTIHGRSCYLGQDHSGQHFFAKGVGWIHSNGWEPAHGNCGVFPRWGAERERSFALSFAALVVHFTINGGVASAASHQHETIRQS